MNAEQFKNCRKIGKTTRLPDVWLMLKGKRLAKKAPESCDSYCEKLVSRCSAIENKEVVFAEGALHGTRLDGAAIVADYVGHKSRKQEIPLSVSGDDPITKRIIARNTSDKATADVGMAAALKKLCEIDEEITNVNVTLDERVGRTRSLCESKLHAFVQGARKRNPGYSFAPKFSDSPVNTYINKHKAKDDAITDCVTEMYSDLKKEDA